MDRRPQAKRYPACHQPELLLEPRMSWASTTRPAPNWAIALPGPPPTVVTIISLVNSNPGSSELAGLGSSSEQRKAQPT